MTEDLSLITIGTQGIIDINSNFGALESTINTISLDLSAFEAATQSALNLKANQDYVVSHLAMKADKLDLISEENRAQNSENEISAVLNSHLANVSNPHLTTASQVGAYTKAETDNYLSDKVDKVVGKGLSTNDFTDSYKSEVDAAYSNNHTHNNKSSLDLVSGTNTGDQIITLQGDVTGGGTGNFTATIANNAVTNAKSAQMAAHTYKGNSGAITANASDIATNTAFNQNFETSTSNIKMDGTVSVGTSSTISRADHVHPADTSKQLKINASGILKGDGAGGVSAATAGTDYLSGTDTNVTKQGNTFNGANQLVKLNSSGQLPAVDGSLITNKADLSLSNINSTAKSTIANLAMPSDTYDSLTLGASGSTYTATRNGYLVLAKEAGAANEYIFLNNLSNQIPSVCYGPWVGFGMRAYIPLAKDQTAGIYYNATGTTNCFRFVHAFGDA